MQNLTASETLAHIEPEIFRDKNILGAPQFLKIKNCFSIMFMIRV